MFEILWDILTYTHGVDAQLAFWPLLLAGLSAGGQAISGGANRAQNKRARAAGTRWSQYGTKAPDKVGGSFFGDLAGGAGKGLALGSSISKLTAPAVAGASSFKDVISAKKAAGMDELKGVYDNLGASPGAVYNIPGKSVLPPQGVASLAEQKDIKELMALPDAEGTAAMKQYRTPQNVGGRSTRFGSSFGSKGSY